MNVRKLNYSQFKIEKKNILSILCAWQKEVKDYFYTNYSFNSGNHSLIINYGLLFHWQTCIKDLIHFLEKEEKDNHENKDKDFEQISFSFFLAEENGIQGIAFGSQVNYPRFPAQSLFGTCGSFFRICEMLIAPIHLLPRCFPIHSDHPHKRIGKELLRAVISHVNTMDSPLPILADPHYNNSDAYKFFEKYRFIKQCGAMGHSCVLNHSDFALAITDKKVLILADKQILMIEDYNQSYRLTLK